MWGLVLALSLTWQERDNRRNCIASRQTIIRNYDHAGKTAKQICLEVMEANEFTYGEETYDECYEYLKFCNLKE